jgi:hypothetical protein
MQPLAPELLKCRRIWAFEQIHGYRPFLLYEDVMIHVGSYFHHTLIPLLGSTSGLCDGNVITSGRWWTDLSGQSWTHMTT